MKDVLPVRLHLRSDANNSGGPRSCYDRMWELWMGRDFFTGTLVDDGLSPKTPIGGVAIVSRRSWPPG